MLTQAFAVDNGFTGTYRKQPVVVQINEVPLASPLFEEAENVMPSGNVELIKSETAINDVNNLENRKCAFPPPPTNGESHRETEDAESNERSLFYDSVFQSGSYGQDSLNDRKPRMRLPLFESLGVAMPDTSFGDAVSHRQQKLSQIDQDHSPHSQYHVRGQTASQSWPERYPTSMQTLDLRFGATPLLTPPEDPGCFQWHSFAQLEKTAHVRSVPTGQSSARSGGAGTQRSSVDSGRPRGISLPPVADISNDRASPSSWVQRAIAIIVTNLHYNVNSTQVQMVVQALPSQTKSMSPKPVFQEVVENIQQQSLDVPYITITHAVSQVISMEEVPASPPATPNTMHSSDDYFDGQTIFTHAAVIPNYHSKIHQTASGTPRPSSIIAAPSSINVSTLERYIPPSSAQEVRDFFSISRRSYLVDRLTELSAANGTLLLVYPTKAGGSTFAKRYIGPVIDPFLRQFVLLNDLTTDAATAMGKMAAIDSMIDFEQMRSRLEALCEGLTHRAPSRGIRSAYSVIHAELTEVTLDRATWLEWFLEQEQGRLRQDLVDYQKAGGRMPSRGFDASPGLLARAVIDGIRVSREAAGDAGIEIGVFVIRRAFV